MPGPFKIASCMLEWVESRKASRENVLEEEWFMLVYAGIQAFGAICGS